jgi:hypothetical protein
MNSMTGFGKAEVANRSGKYVVEVSSGADAQVPVYP